MQMQSDRPQTTIWTPWESSLPSFFEPVEWRRDFGDQKPFVAAWCTFHPEFNVAGLSWRPLSAKLRELGIYA